MKKKNSNLRIYSCDKYSERAEMLKMYTNIITMTGYRYMYMYIANIHKNAVTIYGKILNGIAAIDILGQYFLSSFSSNYTYSERSSVSI